MKTAATVVLAAVVLAVMVLAPAACASNKQEPPPELKKKIANIGERALGMLSVVVGACVLPYFCVLIALWMFGGQERKQREIERMTRLGLGVVLYISSGVILASVFAIVGYT